MGEDSATQRRKAIVRAIRAIPRGRVASYGEIAAQAGLPGRARLVGRVLREAGDAARLPWHRVVRANGSIAFDAGSEGFVQQSARLAAEGVAVGRGRVDTSRFGCDTDVDAELWAPRDAGSRKRRG